MNLQGSFRYQLADHKKSIFIFYLIMFGLYLLFCVGLWIDRAYDQEINSTVNLGEGMTTLIFLFVSGLCSFKENFGMLTQNGVSRKSLLVGRILVMATICLFMALVDKVWYFVGSFLSPLFDDAVKQTLFLDLLYHRSAEDSMLLLYIKSFFFNYAVYFAVMSAGFLITVIFYRLGKLGKLIAGAGVPALFLIVLPIVDFQFFAGEISRNFWSFVGRVLGIHSGNPWCAVATCLVVSVGLMAIGWILVRRASLHE